MNAEDQFLRKRLLELANQCFHRSIPTHSDFLSLYEQDIFYSILNEMPPVSYKLMGGYLLSERKCVVFYENEYDAPVPYDILHISPSNRKYAEELGHRDYLGALMNLGIKREQLGDLILHDGEAYVFCMAKLSSFICDSLTSVKHTPVRVIIEETEEFTYSPKIEVIRATVASLRLDAILAHGFNLSRNHAVPYIEEGKVFVNGRMITTNAYSIHDQDLISVRGLGKIQYIGCSGNSRKDRMIIELHKFI